MADVDAQTGSRKSSGSMGGRAGSSTDLTKAMEAAAIAAKGPDLDAVTEELVKERRSAIPEIDIEALDVVRPIGMGGQGGVWLGIDPASGLLMAVKQIRKGRLTMLPKKAMTRALTERECLLEVGFHPFITTCYACFQNDSSLFFSLELAPAGDLFGLLDLHPTGLPEAQARFYCTCIALALRHVHAHGWVYRDVKLENVLICNDGYAKICDFGFAKKAAASRTFTKCGTDEYAPPEVVSGRGRTCTADWWALGILLHEMLTGRPPFEGSSAEEVFRSITDFTNGGKTAADQLEAQLLRTAEQCSPHCAAFLMGLLKTREAERLGGGPAGFIEIQQHAWFDDVEWEATLRRELPAPYVPPPQAGGAVDAGVNFDREDVMLDRPYDAERWAEVFAEFGPFRKARWPGDC